MTQNIRSISMTATELRIQAERCRRLARECSLTERDQQLLNTIADEYEALIPLEEGKNAQHAS